MLTSKKIKHVFSLFLLLLIAFASSIVSVQADALVDNKGNEISFIGSNENDSAIYGVSKTEEQKTLEFGLQYRYDKAYVNTTASGDITADMNAAGGGAYASSGKMLANTYYPTDVRLFEVSPELGLQVVPWIKFKNGKWTLNTVLAMAKDYESSHPGYKVVGAINADFFDINSKNNYNLTSSGGSVADGNYYKVNSGTKSIGFKNNTLIGNITPTISEKPILEIFDEKNQVIFSCDVDKINEEPTGNETSVYMAFYSEEHKAVAFDVEDSYIINASILVPFSMSSIYGIGTLSGKLAKTTIDNTNYAIKTNNTELIAKLTGKVTVRVQYTYTEELEGYDYVVGYGQNLLINNENVAPKDYRHPRTAIGVKADGTIVMAEIDGRQANINCYGATLKEVSALMQYYGCVDAFNLDGGGSSTICLIQDGELTIQNSTSDGSARSDSNCLLIVAKVPVLEVEASDVTKDSFALQINVVEMIETYKDLYICCDSDGQYKKVENGNKIVYTNLAKNSKFSYQIYAKVGNEYVMIPYSGVVNTAKEKYSVENIHISLTEVKGELNYKIDFNVKDDDSTIITNVLVINGKRYYAKSGVFNVPVEDCSPLVTGSKLQFTYNINDTKGSITEEVVVNATIEEASIAMNTMVDEVNSLFNNLFE